MDTAVVFDLDDTLIDTRSVLVPPALERVSRATGIDVERLDACGKKVDEVLAGIEELTPDQREAAAAAWYALEVPRLDPLPGARQVLATLRGKVRLILLTRGDPARQALKIARAGLEDCFDEIVVRPIEGPGSKRDDLERILERYPRCIVVGDDPEDELRHAAELGCATIRVPDVPLGEIGARVLG